MADVVVENTEELVVNEEELENEDVVVIAADEEETAVTDDGRTFVSEENAQIAEEAARQARLWAEQSESSADTAQYYAENIKFGMIRKEFTTNDWTPNNDKYEITYNYEVVVGVYKINNTSYELMTNIDVVTSATSVTIVSPDAFDGYVLLVNNAESMGDKTFVYEQAIASDTWNIQHNLVKQPSVEVVDTANNKIETAVEWVDENNLIVRMNAATKGKAFLN